MGYFDLPRGEVTIKVKDGKKTVVKSIAFTDCLYTGEVEQMYEEWSKHYKIIEMQFNGRTVKPCKKYHWELRHKEDVYGTFKTREECENAMKERRRKKREDKTIIPGIPYFVKD